MHEAAVCGQIVEWRELGEIWRGEDSWELQLTDRDGLAACAFVTRYLHLQLLAAA